MVSFAFVLSVVAALGANEARAFGRARTRVQVSLGDSISSGFLGFSSISTDPAGTVNASEEEPRAPLEWWKIRYLALLESKRKYAWTTGEEIDSVSRRLERYEASLARGARVPLRFRALNLAETGAQMQHLPRQARLAREAVAKLGGPSNVSLVTLSIGANDACRTLTPEPEEPARLRQALYDSLSSLAPPSDGSSHRTPVFVLAVPNIPAMSLPPIADHPAYFGLTCAKVREKLVNFCPDLLNWTTPEEYEARVARVRAVNDSMRATVAALRADFPTLDPVFYEGPFEENIPADALAWDCFHPGRRGHEIIAERFWNAMPWFGREPSAAPRN